VIVRKLKEVEEIKEAKEEKDVAQREGRASFYP
jgi:hypothetical protein